MKALSLPVSRHFSRPGLVAANLAINQATDDGAYEWGHPKQPELP
jgi:hypothetical protein